MVAAGGMTEPTPEQARQAAREILSRAEFRASRTPRPLRGVLRQLGRWLEPIVRPVGRPLGDLWRWVVEDPRRFIPAGIVVLLVAAIATVRLSRHRAAFAGPSSMKGERDRIEDPATLERLAVEAERAGQLDDAVRLRFRAGLLRLDAAGALAYRPSLTAGAVLRAVPVPALADLARAFDEIAYGGRPAGTDDVRAAREGWPRVLAEARS